MTDFVIGVIFINLMGTALTDSWSSVEMVRNEARVVRKMEQIIAVYVKEINSSPSSALTTVYDDISGGNYNEAPPGDPYTITVTAGYITFSGGVEQSAVPYSSNAIKVTVQAGDNRLTTILTKSRSAGDRVVRY